MALDVDDAIRFAREARQIALAFNLDAQMGPRFYGHRGYSSQARYGFETEGFWDYSQKSVGLSIATRDPFDEITLFLSRDRQCFWVTLKEGAASWTINQEYRISSSLVRLMACALFKLDYDISSLEKTFALKITPRKKMQWLLEMEGARAQAHKNERESAALDERRFCT